MDSKRRRALRNKYIAKRLRQLDGQLSMYDPDTADLLRLQQNRLAKTSVRAYAGRKLHRKECTSSHKISVVEDIIREQRQACQYDQADPVR
jgi:hypothetical protein